MNFDLKNVTGIQWSNAPARHAHGLEIVCHLGRLLTVHSVEIGERSCCFLRSSFPFLKQQRPCFSQLEPQKMSVLLQICKKKKQVPLGCFLYGWKISDAIWGTPNPVTALRIFGRIGWTPKKTSEGLGLEKAGFWIEKNEFCFS